MGIVQRQACWLYVLPHGGVLLRPFLSPSTCVPLAGTVTLGVRGANGGNGPSRISRAIVSRLTFMDSVAWVSVSDARCPSRSRFHATRTYSGRPGRVLSALAPVGAAFSLVSPVQPVRPFAGWPARLPCDTGGRVCGWRLGRADCDETGGGESGATRRDPDRTGQLRSGT